jgi:hypothetical protein
MKRTLLALAATLSLASAASLGSAPAYATAFTCNEGGNPPPSSVTGDAVLTESGSCTLGSNLTATGQISITAGGAVSIQALTAGSSVSVTTSSGDITMEALTSGSGTDIIVQGPAEITGTTLSAGGHLEVATTGGDISISGDINSNLGNLAGNILLMATGNIGTGSISTNGGTSGGSVEIDANTAGTNNNVFNIGGGGVNGVNGTINASVTTAGGSNPDSDSFGILVANGDASSTGGITVQSMDNINATASASKSGLVVLNAQNGTLTLPAGTLSVDGQSGNMAGSILLLANQISTAEGTVLSSMQSSTSAGSTHAVVIAANTIMLGGSTSGLQIHADGNGVSASENSFNLLGPQGVATYTTSGTVDDRSISVSIQTTSAPFTVSGSGPLTVTANGTFSEVEVSAKPITFSNTGTLTLTANGASSEIVSISNPIIDGSTGLTFSGGNVVLSANGVSGVGDSAGGQIQINSVDTLATPTGTVSVSANGDGSANGGSINFTNFLGDLSLGNVAGTFTFSATGGPSGGNGGTITLSPELGNLILDASATTESVAFNAPGSDGNGGTLTVSASGFVNNVTGALVINGNGGTSTGNGGTVSITLSSGSSGTTLPFDGSGLSITASAVSGNGGSVTIDAGPNNLAVDGSGISVSADSNGSGTPALTGPKGSGIAASTVTNGNGGTITLTNSGDATITGAIDASGTGTGNAGVVSINAGTFTLDTSASITANGAASSATTVVLLTSPNITFNGDSSISTNNGRVAIAVPSDGASDLTLSLVGGATETITAPNVFISNTNAGNAVTVSQTGSGTANFNLSTPNARLTSLGAVTIGSNVAVTSVQQLFFQFKGVFTHNGAITAVTRVNFDPTSSAPLGSVMLSGNISVTGTTGSEALDIGGGNGITQTAGVLTNSAGEITLHVKGTGDIGSSASPVQVSTGQLTASSAVNALNVFVSQTNAAQTTTFQGAAPGGTLSVTSAGQLNTTGGTVAAGNVSLVGANGLAVGAVTATAGNVVGIATSGTLTVAANSTVQATSGEVDLVINSVPASPVMGTAPANVSASGTIFWGSNSITAAAPTNTVSASTHRIVFDEHSTGSSAITLGGGVTVQTN